MRYFFFPFLICLLFFLSSCAQSQIVDEMRIVHTVGFDLTADKKIKGTIIYPVYNLGKNKTPKTLSSVGRSGEVVAANLAAKSPHKIVVGQTRMIVFGSSLSKQGISNIIGNLQRDPNIGRDVQIAIVDGAAEQLLKHTVKNGSLYLSELIDQNVANESIPTTNLHVFLYNYFSFGCDPFLPYIRIDGEDSASLQGLAFLKKDEIMMYANNEDSFLIKLIMNSIKNGRYEVDIQRGKNKGVAVIHSLSGNSTYHITDNNSSPKVEIKVKLNGLIKDSPSWINLENPKNISYIEAQLQEHIEKHLTALISQFQNKKIDPLGVRDQIRSHSRKWNMKQLSNMYPSIDVSVKAKVNIVQSGIGE
ncbi:Ger(x)C family spore germination protein [Bacillus rhizoplanae]|uniref:Ger(x)C family spore germination protein n=1 Tax=Bacillus rhizoplanae TaxID=2880966 RepID=UPI003D1B8BC5